MERMGHSSPRAAPIYQHATRDRDKAIAAAMGGVHHGQAEGHNQRPIGHATGTEAGEGFLMARVGWPRTCVDLGFLVGAGEGNRTLMTSLEGR